MICNCHVLAPGDQSLDSAIHQIDEVTLWIVIYLLCSAIHSLEKLGSPAYFFFWEERERQQTTDNSQSFDVWRSGNSQGVAVGRGCRWLEVWGRNYMLQILEGSK